MIEWNLDLKEVPGPRIITRTTTTVGGKTKTYKETVPTYILVSVDNLERQVLSSYWIPPNKYHPNGRFAFLASDQLPLAWAPYPPHIKDV